jgi:hypothetical protein
LKRRWVSSVAVALLALGLTVMVTPAPAHANILLGQKNRTIYSPDFAESQVWHVQFWQTLPVPKVCKIFGRSVMDTFRGQHGPWDYLDSIRLMITPLVFRPFPVLLSKDILRLLTRPTLRSASPIMQRTRSRYGLLPESTGGAIPLVRRACTNIPATSNASELLVAAAKRWE